MEQLSYYRVCQGFRLTKQDDYFWVNFDHIWSKREAAGAVVKISSSLQTPNFNQVKLVQIRDTHCISIKKIIIEAVFKGDFVIVQE